jgi:hypothetical protein
MWRILLITFGFLAVALTACEQTTAFNTPWGNGDYEVVALIANR